METNHAQALFHVVAPPGCDERGGVQRPNRGVVVDDRHAAGGGRGVTGDRSAAGAALEPRIDAATLFVQDNYIPQTVLTNYGGNGITGDSFSVIALPLAVAAVADIAGVSQYQLASLVTTRNNANVPPAQIIEVVRYVPVALVDNGQPFVAYVQQQVSQGVTGLALVPVIERQLQPYYPSTQIRVTAPPQPVRTRTVVVDQNFLPPMVVNRINEVRLHPRQPHGGPPGQLKKQLGVQTGAEVVHGKTKGQEHGRGQKPPMASPRLVVPPPQPAVVAGPGKNGRGPGVKGPPGQNKVKEHGKGHGHDKGKGKARGRVQERGLRDRSGQRGAGVFPGTSVRCLSSAGCRDFRRDDRDGKR